MVSQCYLISLAIWSGITIKLVVWNEIILREKNQILKSPPKISNWGVGDDGEGEICTVQVDVMWRDVIR